MLLTITTTHRPADELGYLLGKHPDRVHRGELSFGTATVCFPVCGPTEATAALVVDVDPVRLVRGPAATLTQYVNDRPYAASSLLSVAIGRTLGSALHGRCRERPELAATAIPLELAVPVVRDADGLAERLFAPLGWRVVTSPVSDAGHVALRLTGTRTCYGDDLSFDATVVVTTLNRHQPQAGLRGAPACRWRHCSPSWRPSSAPARSSTRIATST